MAKKEVFVCDVCNTESEEFYNIFQFVAEDLRGCEFDKFYLSIRRNYDEASTDSPFMCRKCFLKYLEYAVGQMKERFREDEENNVFNQEIKKYSETKQIIIRHAVNKMASSPITFKNLYYELREEVSMATVANWVLEKKYKTRKRTYIQKNPIESITKSTLTDWANGYRKSQGGKCAKTRKSNKEQSNG